MPDIVPIKKADELTRSFEAPIALIRTDQDDHTVEVAEIRRLFSGLTLPQGACRAWTALHAEPDDFIGELERQMRLGNEVPFPQFDPGGTVHV